MALLEVEGLKIHFPIRGGLLKREIGSVKAVDDVSFSIEEGQTYGLVGESGSGKTTTGRAIIGLNHVTDGKILFNGKNLATERRKNRQLQRDVQMIFQDPYSSLNPKKRVIDIIAEPFRNYERLTATEEKRQVRELLEKVGLSPESIYKYPHEFSGGQRQRIGIARAIALKPKLIIADEPVSALDVSVQAQVLNFMQEIQKELNLTYLFISHDLGIIRHMCDQIGIMYKGRYVEQGTTNDIFENPQHIYTKRLIAAIPDMDPTKREEMVAFRQQVKSEYEHSYRNFFDEEGLAYSLKSISDTHRVALPQKG
ncbi:ATP-binding cassette domain-containing protein [Paenibacillus sp. FSL H7-0942]|uniref:Peptide/nickel transport system ATP-binding protein n=1 Tax=Paenibacillus xylanexedens TaxID=528191 RepID=A0ABS4RUW7_PAEXY|nr:MULTISPECIES: ATP-binding cassette domain-containing protein [Paenibacillus]KLU57970.1 peptide ABC transporter substrate-binding protein [Paenibacillus sp. VT-400]MBP2246119.1 peptide/nickel transport system ATP-binding protein [Paenibacillus xylanexedens]MCP1423927.1 peptide/nickel transport system ATP-binding protein [Paenibacillus xylanexedens]OME91873.1 ABC transporter ATP-binding protein [Paenibacillus amylolyticus]OMF02734.1 ABC transporter ATP-binding protein [Paenibacillus amylolyti